MTDRFLMEEPWIERVRQGDFSAIPNPLTWEQTSTLSHLLHGYRTSLSLSLGELRVWANQRAREAARTGTWHGTALELWLCLFYERRRYRHMDEGEPEGRDLQLLNQLCQQLRCTLQTLSPEERVLILDQISACA
jgi:hypothetical protein